ncbi:late [Abeliophyllum distichum]|uniref:Late n=1 Tax=Abeliophyllum distichum TaxID=126358 RepID=A0ABD1PAN1_9LAMI
MVPNDKGRTWEFPEVGLRLKRLSETNKIQIKVDEIFDIVASVVPIILKESLIHGYDVTEEDCFAHLELNFRFESLSNMVDGVLGQTYRPSYQTRVKISSTMPIMGGSHKFASSHLFATDCAVSKFGRYWKNIGDMSGMQS